MIILVAIFATTTKLKKQQKKHQEDPQQHSAFWKITVLFLSSHVHQQPACQITARKRFKFLSRKE